MLQKLRSSHLSIDIWTVFLWETFCPILVVSKVEVLGATLARLGTKGIIGFEFFSPIVPAHSCLDYNASTI